MTQKQERRAPAALYTKLELGHAAAAPTTSHAYTLHEEQNSALRDLAVGQERTNELLEELLAVVSAQQKQRVSELNQWKHAHPRLAKSCHEAAEALAQVQVAFLNKMTEEINDTADDLMDGEFMLTEFVDRFGPRLAHLNGVIQVLAQLSSLPNPTDTSREL